MKKQISILIFLVLISGIAHAQKTKPLLLRYRYPENKQVLFKNNSYTDMNMGGISLLAQGQWLSAEIITTEPKDTLPIGVTYTDISESILISGQLIQQPTLRLLADKPFRFALSPRGNLKQFEPPRAGAIGFDQVELFEILAANLELQHASLFPELPEKPVGVGDTWTSTRRYSVPYMMIDLKGTIEVNSTYTIKKAKKQKGRLCFEIEETSDIQTHTFFTYGELSAIGTGTVKSEGKWLFDCEQGLILKYETKGILDAESTLLNSKEPPVATKAKVTFKRELKDINDM